MEQANRMRGGPDINWILLLMFLYNNPDVTQKIAADWIKADEEREYPEKCSSIEWRQYMGWHIPFCRIDGELCNMQCRRRAQ